MLKSLVFLLAIVGYSLNIYAASVSNVTKDTCSKVKGTTQSFILLLKPDENIFTSINECSAAANIRSASLTGIGGVKEIEFSFFTLKDGEAHKKTFSGSYALTALIGNVTTNEKGELQSHLHAVVNNMQFNTLGGHLANAKVFDNVEITITPMPYQIKRKMNKKIGFEVID